MAAAPAPLGPGASPVTSKIAPRNRPRPAIKAPNTRTAREAFAAIVTLRSTEARHKPGADRLKKDRRAIIGPEQNGAREDEGRRADGDQQGPRQRWGCSGFWHGKPSGGVDKPEPRARQP